MTRKVRTHVEEGDVQETELAPKHVVRQNFANKLYNHMLDKGWNQSELARRAGLNRDAVSTYVRGKVLPTPVKLGKLARALNVKPESLLAKHTVDAIAEDAPSFEIKVSGNAPDRAWLRVDRLVSMATAVKIAELLQSEDAAERI